MADPYASNPAWPTHWGRCHLVGHFVDLAGHPITGTIEVIAKPQRIMVPVDDKMITPVPLELPVTAGVLDSYVPASDDPDILPYGWTYTATQSWDDDSYPFEAPLGLTVDMTQVAPIGEFEGVLILAQLPGLTQAAGDLRYVRTVNHVGPDGSGDVEVSGGGGTGGAAPDGAGGLDLTPGSGLTISSDGGGGLDLGGSLVTSGGDGSLTIG